MNDREQRLSESLRLMEETGDPNSCMEARPDLRSEISAITETTTKLEAASPAGPQRDAQASSRRLLLTALPAGEIRGRRLVAGRPLAALAVFGIVVGGAVAAAASGGSAAENGSALVNGAGGQSSHTLKGEHGLSVSEAVHAAIAATTPGPERGLAVSLAACDAAHDRTTLPEPAQMAPGQLDRTPVPCSEEETTEEEGDTGDEETTEESTDEEEAELAQGEQGAHGKAVSEAVHEAQANTPPGPERGAAVSQAACEAAHDRSTLPEKAQSPPGLDPEKQKDCTRGEDGETAEGDTGDESTEEGTVEPASKKKGPPEGKGPPDKAGSKGGSPKN